MSLVSLKPIRVRAQRTFKVPYPNPAQFCEGSFNLVRVRVRVLLGSVRTFSGLEYNMNFAFDINAKAIIA